MSGSELNLQGKRVLITGGASGIGRSTAEQLIAYGATVVIADLSEETLGAAQDTIGAHGIHAGDVTREDDCRAMVSATIAQCGGIDALVNCAGISDKVAPAVELAIEDWQRIVDVNLRGSFLMARTAGREMIAQRHGSIVNVSSIYGVVGVPYRHAYGPAKAGVAMLTRNLACEWGTAGVRVNAIAPGYIATPMTERQIREGIIDMSRLEARTPMGRFGTPREVANVAAFLVSELSSYITGAILPVDGGWTAFGGAAGGTTP